MEAHIGNEQALAHIDRTLISKLDDDLVTKKTLHQYHPATGDTPLLAAGYSPTQLPTHRFGNLNT